MTTKTAFHAATAAAALAATLAAAPAAIAIPLEAGDQFTFSWRSVFDTTTDTTTYEGEKTLSYCGGDRDVGLGTIGPPNIEFGEASFCRGEEDVDADVVIPFMVPGESLYQADDFVTQLGMFFEFGGGDGSSEYTLENINLFLTTDGSGENFLAEEQRNGTLDSNKLELEGSDDLVWSPIDTFVNLGQNLSLTESDPPSLSDQTFELRFDFADSSDNGTPMPEPGMLALLGLGLAGLGAVRRRVAR